MEGAGLEAIGVPPALLGPLVGPGPEGVRTLDLHDLVHQHGDGRGEPVEAVLGQEFRDLVEGGSSDLGGHRRRLSGSVWEPSRGTGGAPPLQAETNLQKG
jgi:hypothetical protein